MPGPKMGFTKPRHHRARSNASSPPRSMKSRDEADIKSDERVSPTSAQGRFVLGSEKSITNLHKKQINYKTRVINP